MASDVARFLRWLTAGWPPESGLELRVLSRRGALAGLFVPNATGLAWAGRAVTHWGSGLAQVYCGLNPRRPPLLAAAPNRLDRTGRAGREEDVAAVTAVLVDIDPRRPKGTASTDAELGAARDVARSIDRWWREQGWHPPLVVMSGNGCHLCARVPPQDPGTFPDYLRSFLAGLAERFGSAAADVDLVVADAPRIAKVPGTVSIKGENTPDRPWRRAAILAWSDPVPNERLAAHILSQAPIRHYRRIGRGTRGETAGSAAAAGGADRPAERPLKPRVLLDRMLSRCRFVQWCRDHPAAVREPGWYGLATNLAVFAGGEDAFHRLSAGYPGYDPGEAERKFAHAVRDAPGPTTCRRLAELGELGYTCPWLDTCPAHAPAALAHVSELQWQLTVRLPPGIGPAGAAGQAAAHAQLRLIRAVDLWATGNAAERRAALDTVAVLFGGDRKAALQALKHLSEGRSSGQGARQHGSGRAGRA